MKLNFLRWLRRKPAWTPPERMVVEAAMNTAYLVPALCALVAQSLGADERFVGALFAEMRAKSAGLGDAVLCDLKIEPWASGGEIQAWDINRFGAFVETRAPEGERIN